MQRYIWLNELTPQLQQMVDDKKVAMPPPWSCRTSDRRNRRFCRTPRQGHKATKLLMQLNTGKSFGLIERVKQRQGRPTKIFVKRFTTRTIPPKPALPQPVPRLLIFGNSDCGKSGVQTAEKPQQVILNQIRLILVSLIHLSIHRFPDCRRNG